MFSTLVVSGLGDRMEGVGFGFGIMLVIIPLFIIGLFFLAMVLLRRRWARNGVGPGHFAGGHFNDGHNTASRGAESTLAERFAQGDIDEKEYRARLEVLRANSLSTPPTS